MKCLNVRYGGTSNPSVSAWIKSTPAPGSPLISEIPRKHSHFGSVVFQDKSPNQSRVVSLASNTMERPLALSDPENVSSKTFRKRQVPLASHNTQSDVEGSDRTIETEEEQGDDEDPGTDANNQDDDDISRPYTNDTSTPTPCTIEQRHLQRFVEMMTAESRQQQCLLLYIAQEKCLMFRLFVYFVPLDLLMASQSNKEFFRVHQVKDICISLHHRVLQLSLLCIMRLICLKEIPMR